MLEALEPVLDEVVVTRTTSPRAMRPATTSAEVAADVFGEDRVHVARSLPDAPRAGGRPGRRGRRASAAGVLATGSVDTAAEVRTLMGAS